MAEDLLNPPADPANPPADPPADPAPPADPPADPATNPPADDGNLLKPPVGDDPEPPKVTGDTYDWEADPLGLGNLPMTMEDKQYLLAGKYKGATAKEAVQALEKGYNELYKTLRAKGQIAPDEYSFEGEQFSSLNETARTELGEFGKKLGLTQAQLEAFVPEVQELAAEIETKSQKALLAEAWEVKPDSPEFSQREGELSRWVDKAIREGMFSAEQIYGDNGLAKSAGGVRALEAVKNSGAEKGFWTSGAGEPAVMSIATARAYLTDTTSAYHDPTKPDHARIREQVDAAYEAQPGAQEVIIG